MVTSGSAAIRPPNLSLRFATSEIATTNAAVTRYFVTIQLMCGTLKGLTPQGKRRRSTEGAQGTNTGHENAEGMACVGVRVERRVRLGRVAEGMTEQS